jgi:hypothetical protein
MPSTPRPPLSATSRSSRAKGAKRSAAAAATRPSPPVDDAMEGLPAVDNSAHFIDALKVAAKNAGVKPGVIQALVNRLRAGDPNVSGKAEVKRLEGKALVDAITDKLSMVLHYVDEYAISQANLKDLAVTTGILVEKSLLLKGQPTQIIDFTSRQQITQLVPAMLAEAKRRGLPVTLDATAVRVEG